MLSASVAESVPISRRLSGVSFFFNDTATTEIYTLSLHDALPISCASPFALPPVTTSIGARGWPARSEEHTSELQSLAYIVCRLLLEKKKNKTLIIQMSHNYRHALITLYENESI